LGVAFPAHALSAQPSEPLSTTPPALCERLVPLNLCSDSARKNSLLFSLTEFDNQGWGASASQPRPLDALMREEDAGHKQAQAQAQSPRTSLDTGSRAITRASFAEKGNSRKSLDLSHLHGNMKGAVEILTREHGIF